MPKGDVELLMQKNGSNLEYQYVAIKLSCVELWILLSI